jgi:hypothetical protein
VQAEWVSKLQQGAPVSLKNSFAFKLNEIRFALFALQFFCFVSLPQLPFRVISALKSKYLFENFLVFFSGAVTDSYKR